MLIFFRLSNNTAFMLRVNISKGENMKVPNLPSSTAGECSQFSRQVFRLSLPVSVFTLAGISFSMNGLHSRHSYTLPLLTSTTAI